MKYRKKPVVVDAKQFRLGVTGKQEMLAFCPDANIGAPADSDLDIRWFSISTLEGAMEISDGDYVVRGIAGEFYPCKPDIFEASHEAVA